MNCYSGQTHVTDLHGFDNGVELAQQAAECDLQLFGLLHELSVEHELLFDVVVSHSVGQLPQHLLAVIHVSHVFVERMHFDMRFVNSSTQLIVGYRGQRVCCRRIRYGRHGLRHHRCLNQRVGHLTLNKNGFEKKNAPRMFSRNLTCRNHRCRFKCCNH